MGSTEEGNNVSSLYEKFCNASDLLDIISSFDDLKKDVGGGISDGVDYEKLRDAVLEHVHNSKSLWGILNAKKAHEVYQGEKKIDIKAVVIGAGVAGLRTAIDLCLLGASVTVVEKRDHFSRHNSLHIWDSTIEDMKSIGVKYFCPKFCVGLINHVSIRNLQCALLKVALIFGIKMIVGKEFSSMDSSDNSGIWSVKVISSSATDNNSQTPVEPETIPCNVLIGADGENSHVCEFFEFERKTFQGSRAIGITANFVNQGSPEESVLDEFGLMSIYNQNFFEGLKEKGIDLENLVFYRDETHYFVMTAKKESLHNKGVLKESHEKNADLLSRDNVNTEALTNYIREVAEYCKLPPQSKLATNHLGMEDIGIFDFSKKLKCVKPAKILDPPAAGGQSCLIFIVGDALVEPFWPLGTGANRAVLSAMDAAWHVKKWMSGCEINDVLHDAQSVSEMLQLCSPEELKPSYKQYTIDPHTRYKVCHAGLGSR